jgi:hypothetical protein
MLGCKSYYFVLPPSRKSELQCIAHHARYSIVLGNSAEVLDISEAKWQKVAPLLNIFNN